MRTLIIEFGWVGFGRPDTALFPAVCLGCVRLSWARGSLAEAIRRAIVPRDPKAGRFRGVGR